MRARMDDAFFVAGPPHGHLWHLGGRGMAGNVAGPGRTAGADVLSHVAWGVEPRRLTRSRLEPRELVHLQ